MKCILIIIINLSCLHSFVGFKIKPILYSRIFSIFEPLINLIVKSIVLSFVFDSFKPLVNAQIRLVLFLLTINFSGSDPLLSLCIKALFLCLSLSIFNLSIDLKITPFILSTVLSCL